METTAGMTEAVSSGAGTEDLLLAPFAALAGGDASALETIWEVASRRVYGLALWRTGNVEDARDVVQDVFVRLATRREGLAHVRRPLAWLLTMTHRAAVDVTRRRAVRRAEPLERAAFVAAPVTDPGRTAEASRLSPLLARLPDRQREAVLLREVFGYSFREIGVIAGVPTFTAASRYRLGLARLRLLLEGSR